MIKRNPFIIPSAPVLKRQPPTGPQWLHEVKFDGWRAQLHKAGDEFKALRDGATRDLCAWCFDLLELNNHGLRRRKLIERKYASPSAQ